MVCGSFGSRVGFQFKFNCKVDDLVYGTSVLREVLHSRIRLKCICMPYLGGFKEMIGNQQNLKLFFYWFLINI